MTTARRTALALALFTLLVVAALPPAAGAAESAAQPQPGPLNPAFVEALHDPLVAVGLGHMPSPVEVHVGAATEARAARLAEPASYSLLDEGRVTATRDQGRYSTCWAFSSIGALESRLLPDETWDLSEDNLVGRSGFGRSQSWRYNYGGYDFMAVAYFARWAGPVTEADDPYDGLPESGPAVKHVQGVTMIPGRSGPLDNGLIKRLVRQDGAVSVGMYWSWTPRAYGEFTDDSGAVQATYYLKRAWGENHGVDVVGWDDACPVANFRGSFGKPPGPGAFLVRNSWGTEFGDGGYFWVSYYDRSFAREQGLGGNGGCTSYSDVEGVDNYAQEYQYDKLGVTDHWGYGIHRVWGANRFTAVKTGTIAAAGFYALSAGTRYEIWTGPTLKSMSLCASGRAELPGYTTVPLTSTLSVQDGKHFVVAVKLISPDEGHPLAMERPARTWMSGATARRGQSFLSRNGSTWTDACSVSPDSNVCLKAFAR